MSHADTRSHDQCRPARMPKETSPHVPSKGTEGWDAPDDEVMTFLCRAGRHPLTRVVLQPLDTDRRS